MTLEFRRKLYKRGSSYETTIPMPLLFAVDKGKRYNVVFLFDSAANKWYIKFEEGSKQSFENLSTRVDKVKKASVEDKVG